MNLPERFIRLHQTVCINPLLCEGANMLQHMMPFFHEEARLTCQNPTDEGEVGRLAYELLAAEYGGYEPTVCSMDFIVPKQPGCNIPVRFYKRHHAVDMSHVVLYVHGNGWIRGSLQTHDTLCRRLCKSLSFPLVAIDYQKSPEHPYPTPLDDVECVYNFLIQHKVLLGFSENTKMIVIGDSTGANVAMGLMHRLLQKGNHEMPAALGLFYPVLDMRIPDVTHNPYAVGYMLSRDAVNAHVLNYLGTDQELQNGPEVTPLLYPDEILKGLPPVVIVSAEQDLLTEESLYFTERLRAVNKPFEHWIVPSVVHGFAQFFDLFSQAQESVDFTSSHILETFGCGAPVSFQETEENIIVDDESDSAQESVGQ